MSLSSLQPLPPLNITGRSNLTIAVNRKLKGIEFPFLAQELPCSHIEFCQTHLYNHSDGDGDFRKIEAVLRRLEMANNLTNIQTVLTTDTHTYYLAVFNDALPVHSAA